MHDLRSAFRQLLKSPGFTLIAVVALALGIGANTAVFSVVQGVLLRPLPFPDQERLVFLGEWSEQVPRMSVSYPNYLDFRDRQTSFVAFGAARSQSFNYVGSSETERIGGAMASADLFSALATPPLRGRLYSSDEDKTGAERTVLLREGLWRRHFGGRDDVLGQQINLSGQLYTVVGIMPEEFQYPSPQVELWVPLGLWADQFQDRSNHPGLYCVGRLRASITFEAAQAEMKRIADDLAREYPATNARQSVAMQPLTEVALGQIRPALLVLLGAAACVLLIACANVANLQLARAHARSREFAVRAALGAGRARVARQLLVESLLLGLLGSVAGLALGAWALDGLKLIIPANLPRLEHVRLDLGVLAFGIGAGLFTSVLFGLVPAWHATRQDLRTTLVAGGRSGALQGNRIRALLVVAEFALTCVLLIGAGLMLRTLFRLQATDTGFATGRLVVFNWSLPGVSYPDAAARLPVVNRALDRLRQLPGVGSVGLMTPLPLSGSDSQSSYYIEGSPLPEPGRQPSAENFQVTGETFSLLDMPLLAGRTFDARDRPDSPRVAIVDVLFAERNFGPGVNPVGRRFAYGSGPPADEKGYYEIVGLVPHIQNYGPGKPTREQTYRAYSQSAPGSMTFVLHTSHDGAAMESTLRAAMREVAPDLPIFLVRAYDDLLIQSTAAQRVTLQLLGVFAVLGLLLAALGLYGVLSTIVGQRTREIGIRVALGATAASVTNLVIRHGLKMSVLGLLLGVAASFAATRAMASVLHEVSPTDPLTIGLVLILLLTVGLAACWLPARRASRVNPIVALRAE